MCSNKGAFRDQMSIIQKARAARDNRVDMNSFDAGDEDFVKDMAKDMGFNEEWLKDTKDGEQKAGEEPGGFMEQMKAFMS